MIGIQAISSSIPTRRISNVDSAARFRFDEMFLREKLGIISRADRGEETMIQLSQKAFTKLLAKVAIDPLSIGMICVVTQNPTYGVPHDAAVLHGLLGLADSCASFDISLGCSGYPHALSIATAFMQANKINNGLLFTADSYRDLIDPADRNTALIFGDAATVTLLSDKSKFNIIATRFATRGSLYKSLQIQNARLHMDGLEILRYVLDIVPAQVRDLIEKNGQHLESVDQFLFHPGSRQIIKSLCSELKIDFTTMSSGYETYGNTISSSLPLQLEECFETAGNAVVIAGFGVGLSACSSLLARTKPERQT